jgi:hypothetical protein
VRIWLVIDEPLDPQQVLLCWPCLRPHHFSALGVAEKPLTQNQLGQRKSVYLKEFISLAEIRDPLGQLAESGK